MASARSDAPDLKELRDEFLDATVQLREIREEGATDMRYVAGEPWDPKDKESRLRAGRPAMSLDEIGQYVNQLVNSVRQNKRAIRVTPESINATPQTAEFRQNRIRQIEYKSNAQQAYTTMFENAVQRSYGYLRIVPEYADLRSYDQELRIKPCENPDLVTPDPYAVRTDGSDWKFLYFAERWSVKDFKRRWPRAKVQDFGSEAAKLAPQWVKTDHVMVAERWRISTTKRKLLLVQYPQTLDPATRQPVPGAVKGVFQDELKLDGLPTGATILRSDREVDYPKVTQQLTNGLEILKEYDFPGTSIPFVSCLGKVLYVDEGGGAKRRLLSLIRLARDPYMLYCYIRSAELENVSMALKFPYFTYDGQISAAQEDLLKKSNHEPVALIKVKATMDGLPPGAGPLPFPQRTMNEPAIQALEAFAEAARRAIQAAMGISPLPTEAQRYNQKSGEALKRINDNEQQGSFHFVDHYDDAIMRTGAILNELLPHYDDTAKTVTTRKPDDSAIQVRINDPGDQNAVAVTDDAHDVTIAVGPAFDSERDEASEFADTVLQTIAQEGLIPVIGPQVAAKIVALAIKLKAVGPLGDQMAELLDPTPQQPGQPVNPAQLQAQLRQAIGENQQLKQAIATKQAEKQADMAIAQMKAKSDFEREVKLKEMDNAAKIAVARISAARAALDTQAELQEERLSTGIQLAHEEREAAKDRAHEVGHTSVEHVHRLIEAEQAHGHQTEQAAQQGTIASQAQADAAAAEATRSDDGSQGA